VCLSLVQNMDPNLLQFLKDSRQPAHFDATVGLTSFNYPMIPFCWFGKQLNWLGKVNVSTDFNWYNAHHAEDELLKWYEFRAGINLS
jgi:hypothetical protein